MPLSWPEYRFYQQQSDVCQITKHYKTANEDAYKDINEEAQGITDKHRIADRIDFLAKKEAFLTLKDQKENFEATLPCRTRPSQSIFVQADKTRNLYKLEKEQYEKLMTENITKHYKTANEVEYEDIEEAQGITDKHQKA